MLYDNHSYKKNWLGNLIPDDDVYYSKNIELFLSKKSVSSFIKNHFSKKYNIIKKRYFNEVALNLYE